MSEPWWYQGCLANIKKLGGTMCPTNHCDATIVKNYSEQYCNCTGAYPNGCAPTRKPNCCSYSAESPVPIISENCYCCCGCLANNTPVAVSETETKAIQDFDLGDLVYVADNVDLTSFSQRRVRFSNGTGSGGHNTLIRVVYGEGDDQDSLIVNRPQLFLIEGGLLKAATTLVPGQDELLTRDGSTRTVQSLEVGTFTNGLHHIATTDSAAKKPGGHLLVAKGMVVGDWALQVGLSTEDTSGLSLVPGWNELPEFGTPEYDEAYPDLEHSAFRAQVAGSTATVPPLEYFEPFGRRERVYVPKHAARYLTPKQARDVLHSGKIQPPSSEAGRELLLHLFTVFHSFYPDLNFYLDNEEQLPNAYAFELYGEQQVVVTGGLIRDTVMGYEGMAMVLAHCVASLWNIDPVNDQGHCCLGMADYTAITGVLPHVWIGLTSHPIIVAGMAQIKELFEQIKPEHRGGEPGNRCMRISIECREHAMTAAYDMLPLPWCAGGQPDPALEVVGASAESGVPHTVITVEYNIAVDPKTATHLGAYAFDPPFMTYSAKMGSTPEEVVVTGDAEQGDQYELTVGGVVSVEGQPLKPGKDTAEFTVN